MTWEQIEPHWKEFAGSAAAHWSKLTADDFEALTGVKGHLMGRIQKRYEVTRQEAERQVDEWSDALLEIDEASGAH